MRILDDEMDVFHGLHVITMLLDQHSFYDAIDPLHLIRAMRFRGYPPQECRNWATVPFLPPCFLRGDGCLSTAITPYTSIRAGCLQAPTFT